MRVRVEELAGFIGVVVHFQKRRNVLDAAEVMFLRKAPISQVLSRNAYRPAAGEDCAVSREAPTTIRL